MENIEYLEEYEVEVVTSINSDNSYSECNMEMEVNYVSNIIIFK